MNNTQSIQGIISIAALACLAIGWFNLLSPGINSLLYNVVFYVLIGASFFLQAQTYPNSTHRYIGFAAAAMCVIGAFLPENLQNIKLIGLFVGVILSFFARPKQSRE